MGSLVALSDILVLKMGSSAQAWAGIPGVALTGPSNWINGGLVKTLEAGSCDMMFVMSTSTLMTCSGNYSWISTNIPNARYNNLLAYVPIGAANLWPCTLE